MAIKLKAVGTAADQASYFIGYVGIASVGQAIQTYSGQPITFWVVAFLGAILLRRNLGGETAGPVTLSSVITGVFLAWLFIQPVLDKLAVDPQVWKPVLTALIAGGGEHGLKVFTGSSLVQNLMKVVFKK